MPTEKFYCAAVFQMVCLVVAVGLVGCNQSTETRTGNIAPSRSSDSATGQDQPDLVAGVGKHSNLVGTWLGEAFLEEARLQEKLENLTPDQQQNLLNFADEFLTTLMALDIRADGTLEQEIEITPIDGQPLRDGGTGSWRVIESKGDQVLIETKTTLADGEVVTDRQLYRIYPDGNQIAKRVQLGAEFDSCNPQIILRRQSLPDTNIAQQTELRRK